jgi:hypothetical protein
MSPTRPKDLRRAVSWALWSPRRLLLVIAGGVLLIVLLGSRVNAGPASHDHRGFRGGSQSAQEGRATSLSDRPGAAVAAPPSKLPVGAEQTAVQFVSEWARPGVAEAQWFAALQPLAAPTYDGALENEEPWSVPAHRVTGSPAGRGDAHGASVTVPTDAGPEVVTLVHQGSTWLVTDVEPAPTG